MRTRKPKTADEKHEIIPGRWETVKQAAARLQVSESLIRQMFHEGRILGRRIGKKLIRIAAEALVIDAIKESPRNKPPMEVLGNYRALGETEETKPTPFPKRR